MTVLWSTLCHHFQMDLQLSRTSLHRRYLCLFVAGFLDSGSDHAWKSAIPSETHAIQGWLCKDGLGRCSLPDINQAFSARLT